MHSIKAILILILVLWITPAAIGQGKFGKQQVLDDLEYMRKSLEEAHYNLYTYTTKKAFDQNYQNVLASISKDSLSLVETTSLLQKVISKANNGHTEINFPGSAYGQYGSSGGTLFPLELAFEDGKALIKKNLSGNADLKVGREVVSINGLSMEQVLAKIFPLISAERRYFKLAKLELFAFPRYYWQAFGEQKQFEVTIKTADITQNYQLGSVAVFEGFEDKRTDFWIYQRGLEFYKNSAYLKAGHLSGDLEAYKRFIDSCFTQINRKNPPNLIIDLRNNLGGNDSFGDYLISYIANKPFRWYSEFSLKTSAILKDHVRKKYDTTQVYWKSVLGNKNGSIYPYDFGLYNPQPKDKRYLGKVYALVNRQSHSMSAVAASQFQDYHLATIVGEETGDSPSLLASQYSYFLPNTGIEVKLAKGYIVRVSGSKKPEGLQPDIYIRDHLLDEMDEVLEGLLELIDN